MKKLVFVSIALLFVYFANAQNVGIGTSTPSNKLTVEGNANVTGSMGIGNTTPSSSAQLEISSTTKGLLLPRLTEAQRDSILDPVPGLMIWCINCGFLVGELEVFNGEIWTNMTGGSTPTGSVRICDQIWSQKNLNVSTYRNGDTIPNVTNNAEWSALTTGAYRYYDNDSASYAATYGKLYNWYAVNDPRGLAPEGWHIPDSSEWAALVQCLGYWYADSHLKEIGTWHWVSSPQSSPNLNITGFTALPGGAVSATGLFNNVWSPFGGWWSTSTEGGGNNNAWYRWMIPVEEGVGALYEDVTNKRSGLSIRCIKD